MLNLLVNEQWDQLTVKINLSRIVTQLPEWKESQQESVASKEPILPDTKESVQSSMVGLKPFEYQSLKTEAEFFNEFKLTTVFNNVAATELVIVKTSLMYVKDQGWKVNDVEFIGQLTERK